MPPRKGNGCSPQFPRDSVAAALAPPPLLKLTPHPLQGGHTLLPFHSIHRLPSKLLAQTTLSQGSSSFHACLPERHPILYSNSLNKSFFLGYRPNRALAKANRGDNRDRSPPQWKAATWKKGFLTVFLLPLSHQKNFLRL